MRRERVKVESGKSYIMKCHFVQSSVRTTQVKKSYQKVEKNQILIL